jgi:hypothetical protein
MNAKREKQLSISKENLPDSSNLPIVKCLCGAEILLVPDVRLMSKSIEAHVQKHKKKIKNPKQAETEAKRIRDYLIIQVFNKANQTET